MKVLYYSPVINEPTGGGTHARGLVGGFEAGGHEVLTIPALASPDGRAGAHVPGSGALPDSVKAYGREVRAHRRRARDATSAIAAMEAFGPDVLVVRRPAYDLVADSLVERAGCPVVAETNAVYATECLAWGERLLPREVARERALYRRATVVSCVSEEVAAEVRAFADLTASVRAVPNGVDVRVFSPSTAPEPAAARWAADFDAVVAYCGGIGPLHDIVTLARAAALVTATGASVGFLFVGIEPDRAPGILEPAVLERTLVAGLVPHSQVPAWLRAADVCWAAFPYDYPSPLKVYEYLALGVPIVTAGRGLPARVTTESGGGLAVEREDHEAVAAAVLGLVEDPASRQRMGAAGRAWVLANATWARVAAAMLDGVVVTDGD